MGIRVVPSGGIVRPADIVEVRISEAVYMVCYAHAERACLGGRSRFRGRGEDRRASLGIDQIVGQLGQAALSLALTGDLGAYLASRDAANADPWRGDGGYDIPGIPVDIKTSLMRGRADPLTYTLAVRPGEYVGGGGGDRRYVLGLLPSLDIPGSVLLVGWLWADHLELEDDPESCFCGAYVSSAATLLPMRDLII